MDSLELEIELIGNIINKGSKKNAQVQKAFKSIKHTAFSNYELRELYKHIKEMDCDDINLVTITEGFNEDIYSTAQIAELCHQAMPSTFDHAIKSLYKIQEKKGYIEFLNKQIGLIDAGEDVNDIRNKITQKNIAYDQLVNKSVDHTDLDEVMNLLLDEISNYIEDPNLLIGTSTGLKGIDKMLGMERLGSGKLGIICARPKMGKTGLSISITKSVCEQMIQKDPDNPKQVLFYSLEMSAKELTKRLLATYGAETSNYEAFAGKEQDQNFNNLTLAMNKVQEISKCLRINEGVDCSIERVCADARKLHTNTAGVELIVIDYLTLMKRPKAERNDLAYAMITRALKCLAKELNCNILLLTQLNRMLEQRHDKRPMPSDNRETGAIEQDCDFMLGLYRDSVYNELENNKQDLTECILMLNRAGQTGRVMMTMEQGIFHEINSEW